MDYYTYFETYKDDIVAIYFKKNSGSFKIFGNYLIGSIDTPKPMKYETILTKVGDEEKRNQIPSHICIILKEGFKTKYKIHKNTIETLAKEGFSFQDIKETIIC